MLNIPQSSGIYLITCTTNNKTYVGSSGRLSTRITRHKTTLRNGTHHNQHLQRAWDKYGEPAFTFEVLELVLPFNMLHREAHYFKKYEVGNLDRSFNISTDPAAPNTGLKHSPETIQHLSEVHSLYRHSPESKAKISDANKGKKFSPEHLKNMSISRTGKKSSPETRAKLSAMRQNPSPELRYKMGNSMRGKKMLPETLAKIFSKRAQRFIVTNPQGESFEILGLAKFCREKGLDQASMTHVANGKRNHCKGWKCRRPD